MNQACTDDHEEVKAFHPGHMIKQGLEACLQSQSSTQKMSCRNGILVCNGNNNYRRCLREIQLQKNINVTNKALLIEGDVYNLITYCQG